MNLIEEIAGKQVNLLHVSEVWVSGPWKMPVHWRPRWQAEGCRVSTQSPGKGDVIRLKSLPYEKFQWWTATKVGIWPFSVYYNFRWIPEKEVQEKATWWLNYTIDGEWELEKGSYSVCKERQSFISSRINEIDLAKCNFKR